jgi:hypothetical protein
MPLPPLSPPVTEALLRLAYPGRVVCTACRAAVGPALPLGATWRCRACWGGA